MKYGHLERLQITLRTLSPLFIGSGEKLTKKEYILDRKKEIIYFIDLPRLMSFLHQRGLLSAYEAFLINSKQNDLRAFLLDRRINESHFSNFVSYSIPAGEAIKSQNFREVLTFIKDANGRPYIPGSSIKGALRTALAAHILRQTNNSRMQNSILRADQSQPPRKYLHFENRKLEQETFNRLGYCDPRSQNDLSQHPVNDFMRAIQISDSAPLDYDQLTLCGKYDRKPDGTINSLPIYRECIAPGSETDFPMTLELPMLKKAGITLQDIEAALHSFADEHYASFEQYYPEIEDDAAFAAKNGVDIIMGGGAGYVSKTLIYNIFPQREKALQTVSQIMHKQFKQHGHTKDVKIFKVSPHTLKTTRYRNQYYPLGRCELIIR